MPSKPHNRIWIELDKPKDSAHAKELCEQANAMLTRLGVTRQFWYHEKSRRYCLGDSAGYVELVDRGEWFNFNYLATGKV